MRFPAAFALALIASVAVAHPGGLDKNGCHANHETAEYHCHGKKKSPKQPEATPRCVPKRDADGHIKRDYRAKRAFIEKHACPVTGSTDYRSRAQAGTSTTSSRSRAAARTTRAT